MTEKYLLLAGSRKKTIVRILNYEEICLNKLQDL